MSSEHRFTIKTLGCKANQYDSQLLREDLLRRGFAECPGEGDADVCIVNTCTVTAQSDAKSRQAIRVLKRQNPSALVVVTGCYAHVNADEVGRMPEVDAVFDNPSKEILADGICGLLNVAQPLRQPPCSGITFFSGHTRAFVKIQDGCDKNCSYCIVPFARGRSRSRPLAEIRSEIEALVANGYREVVLTGIHIGSFGVEREGDRNRLAELIETLLGIEGLIRVRLSSIDPNEIDHSLIEAIRNSPQVCCHLHIPLQSGSDAILRRMNRGYTRADYLRTVALLKRELPGISITTDVMVGFPGETDSDFGQSREVVLRAEFSKVHIFPFSSRPGTPAERFPHHVPAAIVRERKSRLSADAAVAALKSKKRLQGQIVEVLVEREFPLSDRSKLPGIFKDAQTAYEGFSPGYLRTVFLTDGEGTEGLKNRVVPVHVESFDEKFLFGRRV